jgi:uncharacterized protein YciI
MEKKYYALKLIPCRPDFAQTMTDEERSIMQQHVGYWMDFMNKGHVVVFGPVFDPAGAYGFGVVSADTEDQLQSFMQNDPAATINKYEYYPMQAIVPAANV